MNLILLIIMTINMNGVITLTPRVTESLEECQAKGMRTIIEEYHGNMEFPHAGFLCTNLPPEYKIGQPV